MGIKYLRRVSRFPARIGSYTDPYATLALRATADKATQEYLSQLAQAWHRPSGDHALLEEGLLKYDIHLPKRCVDGDYLAILKKTCDELRPKTRIIPLTLGAAEKHPALPKTTSPGFPWTTQGYVSKADVLSDPSAVGKIHKAWDSIGRGIPWSLPDSLAFHRVVASPIEKEKVRPVWGYPVDVIVEEARWFIPLFEHIKKHCNLTDAFYGLGLETALSGHEHLARCMTEPTAPISLSADLSNFDARVTNWLIRDLFSHVSDWFDFSKVIDSEGKVWNVNSDQTCRRWRAMVSYFINTKVRAPSGLRIQKSHGVPSGSMFTNFIDTLANAVQMRTCIRRVTGCLPSKDYYYGDDSQIFLRESFDLDALALELLLVFGAVLSTEKTILTDNPENIHWLGYYYRPTGPKRSLDFIFASTLFPEREVISPLESCARLVGQMWSVLDAKASVIFYDAVVYLLDRFKLSRHVLESYIQSLPSKAFKFLLIMGLDVSEVHLPHCFTDPLGGRWIPSIAPRPSPRSYTQIRDGNLPEYAFIAEAYSNRALRQNCFHDFDKYIDTFSFYDERDLDEAYFSA